MGCKKANEHLPQGSKLTFFPTCPMGRWLSFLVALTNHAIAQTALSLDTTTTVIARLGAIEYGMMLSMNAVPRMLALQPSPWALS